MERSVLIDNRKDNTYHQILSLLSYTGDIGISIFQLMEISYKKWYKTINRMMEEKKYKTPEGETFKLCLCRKTAPRHYPISYSLTFDTFRSGILDIMGYQYQKYYETYHLHTREHIKPSIRTRNVQLAEIVAMIHHFDTLIYPHEKNIPEMYFDKQFEFLRLSPDFIPSTHNVFYSSVEIKRYNEQLHKDVSGINIARGTYRGLWIMNNIGYIIYYQTEKPLHRFFVAEKRTTILTEGFIKSASPRERKINQIVNRSIIFGKRNCTKTIDNLLKDQNNVGMSLYAYEHFVPIEHYKEVMPWIICENYEQFVNEHIIKSKVPYDKTKFWHGVNKKNEKTICLFDYNLTMIQKLKLLLDQNPNERYRIICFDWQAPVMRSYYEGKVKISVLNQLPDNLYQRLNIKSDLA